MFSIPLFTLFLDRCLTRSHLNKVSSQKKKIKLKIPRIAMLSWTHFSCSLLTLVRSRTKNSRFLCLHNSVDLGYGGMLNSNKRFHTGIAMFSRTKSNSWLIWCWRKLDLWALAIYRSLFLMHLCPIVQWEDKSSYISFVSFNTQWTCSQTRKAVDMDDYNSTMNNLLWYVITSRHQRAVFSFNTHMYITIIKNSSIR